MNKIQSLLITYLTKHGHIQLLLPDGVVLEIGIDQIDSNGQFFPKDDYCWIIASKEDKMAVLDSYNLGVRFNENSKAFVFEETVINSEGEKIRRLDVV